jgi:SAM-dependent methyltransferase
MALTAMPVEDGSFDVIVSALVLNFVPDRKKALAEMRRVARARATVAFYVWNYPGGGRGVECRGGAPELPHHLHAEPSCRCGPPDVCLRVRGDGQICAPRTCGGSPEQSLACRAYLYCQWRDALDADCEGRGIDRGHLRSGPAWRRGLSLTDLYRLDTVTGFGYSLLASLLPACLGRSLRKHRCRDSAPRGTRFLRAEP